MDANLQGDGESLAEALFEDNTPDRLGLTHIDRFEVREQIGVGAMGVVYRVHDPVFSCDRALKILRHELVSEPDLVQRFREEGRAAVRAAGEISHPNIINIYDAGEFENRPYIVMELFRGIPLDKLLATGREFTQLEVLALGEQLAGALASAHSHGVVHRDIKPGNVLLSQSGKLAKLTDFSVAQLKNDTDSSLTKTGVVIGAPRYMPPEQALGREVDGRSDLYGLGIMLYELLTGEKAYKSETFTALLIEISQSTLASVRSIDKSISPGVDRIISKLVEKDPERRFQTADELKEAIQRETRNLLARDMRAKRGIPSELIGAGILGLGVAAMIAATGYVVRNQQVESLENQTAAVGLAYTKALAQQFSLDYARAGEDAGLLYQLQFDEIAENPDIAYQIITLNDGRVLATTEGAQAPEFIPVRAVVRQEGATAQLVQTPSGDRSLQVSQSIFQGPSGDQKEVAAMTVGFPVEGISEITRLTLRNMLIVALLVALIIGIVSYGFIRRFAKPMEKVRDALHQFAAGNRDIRLPGNATGLIGQTFEAFNNAAAVTTEAPVGIDMSDAPAEEWIANLEAQEDLPDVTTDRTIIADFSDTPDLTELAPMRDTDEISVDERTVVFRAES